MIGGWCCFLIMGAFIARFGKSKLHHGRWLKVSISPSTAVITHTSGPSIVPRLRNGLYDRRACHCLCDGGWWALQNCVAWTTWNFDYGCGLPPSDCGDYPAACGRRYVEQLSEYFTKFEFFELIDVRRRTQDKTPQSVGAASSLDRKNSVVGGFCKHCCWNQLVVELVGVRGVWMFHRIDCHVFNCLGD